MRVVVMHICKRRFFMAPQVTAVFNHRENPNRPVKTGRCAAVIMCSFKKCSVRWVDRASAKGGISRVKRA